MDAEDIMQELLIKIWRKKNNISKLKIKRPGV
ncbi:MAG: hypothetical protein IPF52_04525 [Saprospiraceae bacterium]|nr:hypothetical protein [Saprospiraceae bacterium]